MSPDAHALSRLTRCALVVMVAVGLLAAPAHASARRLDSDEIAGRPLSSCDPSHKLAPSISAFSGELRTSDGRVLWSRRATDEHAMASTTKIMTALLTLERCDPDAMVTVSKKAAAVPYALGLRAGERLTVRQLMELALVASSNDAAVALAEHVSGNVPAFANAMNDHARQLDLDATHFANPHGLDAPGHHTSADDLAHLASAAMGQPEFRRIVALRKVTLAAYKDRPARTFKSTNALLKEYPGMLGGKTGFTDDAKYALVSTANRGDMTFTAVIMGAPSSATRFKHTKRLLNWGFKHFRVRTVASATETVGSVPVSVNPARHVVARFSEETTLAVFDLDGPVARDVRLAGSVALPVFEGEPVGAVRLMQGDRFLATATVVAAADVASAQETVGAVPVSDYIDRTVTVRAAETSCAVIEYDTSKPVKRTIKLDPEVVAPVARGARLGEIIYSQDEQVVCRVPVVAATRVDAPKSMAKLGIWLARTVRGLLGAPRMATLQVAGP